MKNDQSKMEEGGIMPPLMVQMSLTVSVRFLQESELRRREKK